MGNFVLSTNDWVKIHNKEGKDISVLSDNAVARFDSKMLGLGDISKSSSPIQTVAGIFDLEGFTTFCSQIEPQFAIPVFLTRFLGWLIDELKKETIEAEYPAGVKVSHPLPFFLKFLGDGILVLWSSDKMSQRVLQNLIVSVSGICAAYRETLIPELKKMVADPPPRLRCGIARGTVLPVGDSADYVGTCINMAARMQKLPGVTVVFNRRGFLLESPDSNRRILEMFEIKSVAVSGIGSGELIGVLRSDLARMSPEQAELYQAV